MKRTQKSTGQHRSRGWPRPMLFTATALVLAGCGGDDQAVDEDTHDIDLAVSCPPFVMLFPVRGPHNTGYEEPWHEEPYWSCDDAHSKTDFVGDHKGVDIWAAPGTPVVASVAGQVMTAKFDEGAGNVVKVRDACGWDYYSGHLQSIAPGIEVGDWVEANTVIGYVGKTGTRAHGVVHLHYSLFPGGSSQGGDYDAGVDPWPYLHPVEKSVCDIPPNEPELEPKQHDQLDLNGDGKSDIVRYDTVNGRVILSQMAPGLMTYVSSYDSLAGKWPKGWRHFFGDLDGDGDDEMFRYDGVGRVVITRFNANLSGISANAYDGQGWGSDTTMILTDLNGDGRDEVVRYNAAAGTVIITKFSSSLAAFTNVYLGKGWGQGWEIHAADLNGDGKDELVRYNGAGRVVLTYFSADLKMFKNSYDNTGWGTAVTLSFPDLDGDGKSEVLRYTPAAGTLVITRFNAALDGITNAYSGSGWGTYWQTMHADLNGDGRDELFRYNGDNTVIVTAFDAASLSSFGNTYMGEGWGTDVQMQFADLDGNGSQEVLRYNPATGGVWVTQFNGSLSLFANRYGGIWGKNWEIAVH